MHGRIRGQVKIFNPWIGKVVEGMCRIGEYQFMNDRFCFRRDKNVADVRIFMND